MTTNALTLQLLAWVAARPRTYRETMEAWRTTCPRLTIWEDSIADGLVSVESAKSMLDAGVVVTERGRALLHLPIARGPPDSCVVGAFSNPLDHVPLADFLTSSATGQGAFGSAR